MKNNLSDYKNVGYWLSVCYEEAPASSTTHAALFFLGRTYTNLDNNSKAISYYQKLLSQYSSSSYGDDALYRMERLYSISGDADKAMDSFGKVFEDYPSGDKTDEALWELDWIQYKKGRFSSAKTTFSNMAPQYRGAALGKRLFSGKQKLSKDLETPGLLSAFTSR